jgi:hypothetical protein
LGEFRTRQKPRTVQRSKTQGYPLRVHINPHHPRVLLAAMLDWSAIEGVTFEPVAPRPGRPPIRPRSIELVALAQAVGRGWNGRAAAQSIEAAKRASAIQPSSLKRVIVDTTVMEKAIA